MTLPIVTTAIRDEHDVVAARQRARQVCALLGFEAQDQARVATAVSEIARNAFRYARGGTVRFEIEGRRAPQLLVVRVEDDGPGIPHLEEVLAGRYRSATGMGMGITGARRLMDQCVVESSGSGTRVVMKKVLPDQAPLVDGPAVARVSQSLAGADAPTPLDEVQQQNRELIRTLGELRERQDELMRVNRELEDTNRGVLALYAELEERADFLRRADETKSRFLSNMSHEFRTPLNSIRALTRLLLDRSDGPLSDEQQTQLEFVRKASEQLSELVEDLLDLAKIEAGKIEVRAAEFSVEDLFSALRGMLRPLLVSDRVQLRFEVEPDVPSMLTDEGKVSQILRNFISNALKFTELGEIAVSARRAADPAFVEFSVTDTGIGIAPEDQERIFEEFAQVHHPLQARAKGTGLGLPLCRRLATLLGGTITLRSALGEGSTFTVRLPVRHARAPKELSAAVSAAAPDDSRLPLLIVEDRADSHAVYEAMLRGSPYRPIPARTLRQAKELFARERPAAIVLDIVLGNETAWRWLGELKSEGETAVPVAVVSEVDDERKGLALGADAYLRKPVERDAFLEQIERLVRGRILLIDDDPASRYTLRKLCHQGAYHVVEAADGREGLRAAAELRPDVIVLDLNLPDQRGEEVLRQLQQSELTRNTPVLVATSERLSASTRERLRAAAAVFAKSELDRETFHAALASLRAGAPGRLQP